MTSDLSAKRFIVVDDMPEMIDTVVNMLRHCGLREVDRASGAEAALAILRSGQTVDCIISDFNMGRFNGLELLRLLRSGGVPGVQRDQRFILLTGHGETEVVSAALALDVNGYVVKPVALKTLSQTIERALSRSIKLKSAQEYQTQQAIAVPA